MFMDKLNVIFFEWLIKGLYVDLINILQINKILIQRIIKEECK